MDISEALATLQTASVKERQAEIRGIDLEIQGLLWRKSLLQKTIGLEPAEIPEAPTEAPTEEPVLLRRVSYATGKKRVFIEEMVAYLEKYGPAYNSEVAAFCKKNQQTTRYHMSSNPNIFYQLEDTRWGLCENREGSVVDKAAEEVKTPIVTPENPASELYVHIVKYLEVMGPSRIDVIASSLQTPPSIILIELTKRTNLFGARNGLWLLLSQETKEND